MESVESVFVDAEDGVRLAKGFGLSGIERGSKAVVSGGVGVQKRVGGGGERLKTGCVPVVMGGEGGGLVVVFHVDYVGLFGCERE